MAKFDGRRRQILVDAIRKARMSAGIRQVDLARKLRVEQSWISRCESGRRPIEVIEYLALAKAIGFDPCELLRKVV